MATPKRHKWAFTARFRRRAFGWRSQPAVRRVKEAVSEIKKVQRKDPVLAAEGAITFLERVSPALEEVDGSSGAIGTAVDRAIDQLVAVIEKAPVDDACRTEWLERLYHALEDDGNAYIERLGDSWGELCATPEIASQQADQLLPLTRRALAPGWRPEDHFSGTSPCLAALYKAERYDELIQIAGGEDIFWPYQIWAVRALVAKGCKAEALRLAESSRGIGSDDLEIDQLGEEILLASGMVEEAYRRYGLTANRGGTYLATFRAVTKRYPSKAPETVLKDLAETTPGKEGKWFAAAKSAGLLDEALGLARRSPCDPRTLTRAARDFEGEQPRFAVEAGLLALRWLVKGHGYEITSADVLAAFDAAITAATRLDEEEATVERIQKLLGGAEHSFVAQTLGPILRET